MAKKMSMKAYEKSGADDDRGMKEGSAKDKKADKKGLAAINAKRKGKK
jgi:hypothetical protein